jgi:hypothetical protein
LKYTSWRFARQDYRARYRNAQINLFTAFWAATVVWRLSRLSVLASTWDPALVEDVFSATASEVRARGSQQCLTQVLDLARDARWGRTEETYGEDPYLVSRIGVAAVKGFQGAGPSIDKSHVIATAKHFAACGRSWQPCGKAIGAVLLINQFPAISNAIMIAEKHPTNVRSETSNDC